MLLPSTTPPAQNGTSPFDFAATIAGGARLARTNQLVARAKNAVYGNCTPPNSYNDGINLASDVASSPAPSNVISSGNTATAFVTYTPGQLSGPPVTVVPLNSGGLPAATPIPPQTTPQGVDSPPLVGGLRMRRRRQSCPPNAAQSMMLHNLVASSNGVAPGWGNAFARNPAPAAPAAQSTGLIAWVQAHPGISFLLGVGALAVIAGDY